MADAGAMRVAAYTARVRRGAFTLIELLVVIAIIALLMAILVPTLRRVRQQGRAVVCRANLRQWGTLEAGYVNENEGRLPRKGTHLLDGVHWNRPISDSWVPDLGARESLGGIQCCPAASRLVNPDGMWANLAEKSGGTFLAWGRLWPKAGAPARAEAFAYGSYAWNTALIRLSEEDNTSWKRAYIQGSARIPVQCDGAFSCVLWGTSSSPPLLEPNRFIAAPQLGPNRFIPVAGTGGVCMNRHDGGINALFLDWSVRKVGLKELWTLKWYPDYNTAGQWTKAGGVEPDDWPKWMRGFKDY